MPNHITNIIRFDGVRDELWAHICETLQGSDPERSYGSVDFNVLIPMPKELNITDSSNGDAGWKAYRKFLLEVITKNVAEDDKPALEAEHKASFGNDDGWELGKKYHENFTKYGHKTWYSWSIANWETKWNAYDCSHNDWTHEFTFLTAWCAPHPVVKAISTMFPGEPVLHKWADEDIGGNVGERLYLNGKVADEVIPEEYSTEAYELAADILGEDLEDCGLVLGDDGQYHSIYE